VKERGGKEEGRERERKGEIALHPISFMSLPKLFNQN